VSTRSVEKAVGDVDPAVHGKDLSDAHGMASVSIMSSGSIGQPIGVTRFDGHADHAWHERCSAVPGVAVRCADLDGLARLKSFEARRSGSCKVFDHETVQGCRQVEATNG
jgi:hypothetical protein